MTTGLPGSNLPLDRASAVLESLWQRPGLGERRISGRHLVGRFVAGSSHWSCRWLDGQAEGGVGDPLAALESCRQALSSTYPRGGVIGYISYEFGFTLLGLPNPEEYHTALDYPLIQFLLFAELDRIPAGAAGDGRRARARSLHSPPFAGWRPSMSADDHRLAVSRIQRHIAAGDIYQANLTQRFESETEMSGREIYRAFARTNPAPFSAYLQFPAGYVGGVCGGMPFPGMDVISCSPERFWKKRGAWIETRPIKGTIARGDTVPADRNNLRQLLRSEKDRAELLMITDLERNDLGRVADVGSVHVRALRRPRSYESVWHLESTITARVAAHIGWHDVMRAMFPGGSITGAPKRRAVEILREIETVPRGVYCGAIGWVDAVGDADFSIAIRTAIKVGDTLSVFGGGGIVADSDPGTEYEESLVKIAPMLNSVQPSAHPFSNTDHLDAATFVEVP